MFNCLKLTEKTLGTNLTFRYHIFLDALGILLIAKTNYKYFLNKLTVVNQTSLYK